MNFAHKEVTLPATLAGMLFFVVLCCGGMAWDENQTPQQRTTSTVVFAVSTLLFIGCIGLHFYLIWPRPDLHPDFLVQLFGKDIPRSAGACDVALAFAPTPTGIRAIVFVQNRFDAEAELELTFKGSDVLRDGIPPLTAVIPPAGLVVCTVDVWLPPLPRPRNVDVEPRGTARKRHSGPQVRFSRHRSLSTEAGAWIRRRTGSGTVYRVRISERAQSDSPTFVRHAWNGETLYSSQARTSDDEIAMRVQQVLAASAAD